MSDLHGKFVWYELMTTDLPAAEAFYGDVVGWKITDSGQAGMTYHILHAGEAPVGGAMTLPPGAGDGPGWIGYIWADDVDAAAASVTAAGGSVHKGPDDIPNVGRFAVVADPQGAVLCLFKATAPGPGTPPPPMGTPGVTGWHELSAGDGPSAFDFYAGQFGWAKGEAMDMGPMGVYQLFTPGTGDAIGAIMTKMPQVPHPFWLFYFCVKSIQVAMDKVTAGGGTVLHGPTEVPGGAWIIQCLDPQGGVFALVGARG